MKICQACNQVSSSVASACSFCGEASWKADGGVAKKVAPVMKEEPVVKAAPVKKGGKRKSAKTVSVVAEISDEDFAAELASASDMDLLSLIGNEDLSDSWKAMVEIEIAKRNDDK